MSVKNSAIRRRERRIGAMERFRIMPQDEWNNQSNRSDDTYEQYVERKKTEELSLSKSIGRM
jgi:hypothetical protein